MPTDPAETVALFRYAVIAEAANPGCAPRSEGGWCAPWPSAFITTPTAASCG
jgi:hypothetical protein